MASTTAGTHSTAMATRYSRVACQACRRLPVAPQTNKGTSSTRAAMDAATLRA